MIKVDYIMRIGDDELVKIDPKSYRKLCKVKKHETETLFLEIIHKSGDKRFVNPNNIVILYTKEREIHEQCKCLDCSRGCTCVEDCDEPASFMCSKDCTHSGDECIFHGD